MERAAIHPFIHHRPSCRTLLIHLARSYHRHRHRHCIDHPTLHRHARPARAADGGRRVPPASEPQRVQQLARLAPVRAAQLPTDHTARGEQQDDVPFSGGGFLEPRGESVGGWGGGCSEVGSNTVRAKPMSVPRASPHHSTPFHTIPHHSTPSHATSRDLTPPRTPSRHGPGPWKSVGVVAERPRPPPQHAGRGTRLGLRALGVPPLARPRRQRHPAGREGGARALGLAQVSGWGVYCCDFLLLPIASGVSWCLLVYPSVS